MASVAILRDDIFQKHSNGPGHPESAARLQAINSMLAQYPSFSKLGEINPRNATEEEITWVHNGDYLLALEQTRNRAFSYIDPDTAANQYTFEAALRAAGGTCEAVKSVIDNTFDTAFALVRPPGHHAERDQALGFCFFNNVAIGAEYALRQAGKKRVFIFDWDVHHGNGTMHSFYNTSAVLYASIHQFPCYPGTGRISETGRDSGKGYTVNIPLPPGLGDTEYRCVFDLVILPVLKEYDPDLVLVSCGFDAHEADPLASMYLSSDMYGEMTQKLVATVSGLKNCSLALVLEGGYSPTALSEGSASVLDALLGNRQSDTYENSTSETLLTTLFAELRRDLGEFWSCLR